MTDEPVWRTFIGGPMAGMTMPLRADVRAVDCPVLVNPPKMTFRKVTPVEERYRTVTYVVGDDGNMHRAGSRLR